MMVENGTARRAVADMSDRELLEELVTGLRDAFDRLAELEQSPMIQAMKTGQNPLMAMLGR